MHDGKAGSVERGVPNGDGTRDFTPRVSALLSALQVAGAEARARQLICCRSISFEVTRSLSLIDTGIFLTLSLLFDTFDAVGAEMVLTLLLGDCQESCV